jgi:hypothetical protein
VGEGTVVGFRPAMARLHRTQDLSAIAVDTDPWSRSQDGNAGASADPTETDRPVC